VARTRGETNGWACAAVGVILIAVGVGLAIETWVFLRSAIEVEGEVIANRKEIVRNKGGEKMTHVPRVRYVDRARGVHQIEAPRELDEPLPLGAILAVYYRPDDPASARLGGDFLWSWAIGFPLLGGFFLTIGTLLIYGSRFLVRRGVPMKT
jgi:hypothetical protein